MVATCEVHFKSAMKIEGRSGSNLRESWLDIMKLPAAAARNTARAIYNAFSQKARRSATLPRWENCSAIFPDLLVIPLSPPA